MDNCSEGIAQDIQDIVQTRVAMAEKLGTIEQHVGATMRHGRTIMTEMAEKTTSSVRETMQVTKDALNPSVHAARHPWAYVGGALVLGYALGTLYRCGLRNTTGVVPYYPSGAESAAVMSGHPRPQNRRLGYIPFIPIQRRTKRKGDQPKPIIRACGPSWNEDSKTNSLRPGVVSSDSDAVSSARWSGKLFPPSCRSSAVLAASETLTLRAIRRVDKLSDRDQLGLILYMQIKTLTLSISPEACTEPKFKRMSVSLSCFSRSSIKSRLPSFMPYLQKVG